MDIEAIVKKFAGGFLGIDGRSARNILRAALTELATGYEEQLEVERMRLAACGVIAMSNTAESAAKARQMLPEYWSASAKDCANAVDREMALRERIRQLEAERVPEGWRSILEELAEDCEHHIRMYADAGDNPMTERELALYRLPIDKARAMLAAAPQQQQKEE